MLGIDIGLGAIKFVVMVRRRRGWCLKAWAVQQRQDVATDGPVPGNAELRETLAAALRRLPVRVSEAAVALNCTEAVTRTIRLDAGLSDHDIENQLAIEADQHLPFALSDASLDFCRLPESADARAPGQDVLLVACRVDCVAQRVSLLTDVGLKPVVVDLDALALCRLTGSQWSGAPHVVLDLGAKGFRLHAVADGRLLYSRAHQVAMPAPTGFTRDPQPVQRLLQEIKRAVQLMLISTACKDLTGMSLVGGLASLPGLATSIANMCGRPSLVLSPSPDILEHPRIERAQWHAMTPQLALACALAMRGR